MHTAVFFDICICFSGEYGMRPYGFDERLCSLRTHRHRRGGVSPPEKRTHTANFTLTHVIFFASQNEHKRNFVRMLTVPQSPSVTAPLAQGSLGLCEHSSHHNVSLYASFTATHKQLHIAILSLPCARGGGMRSMTEGLSCSQSSNLFYGGAASRSRCKTINFARTIW